MHSDHIDVDHEDHKSIFKHLTLWMGILIALLVILNSIFFVIYRESHSSDSLYSQLWTYFESNVFQGVTASLVTPIILFFIENRLKLLESFQEDKNRQRKLEEKKLEEMRLDARERKNKEIEEQKEKERRLQDLVERHLIQFEESVSSVWRRLYNLTFDGGRRFMNSKGKDDYYLNSTLYSLACLLAYKRIFLIDGIYAKIDLCRKGLGDEIKEKLEVISSNLDNSGKKFANLNKLLSNSGTLDKESRPVFFRYHQLALAESVMEKENDHYEITTYTEFRKRYQHDDSIEYALITPARDFIEFLGREREATQYEKLVLMKSLEDLLMSLAKIIEISVKKEYIEKVDEELKRLEKSHIL